MRLGSAARFAAHPQGDILCNCPLVIVFALTPRFLPQFALGVVSAFRSA
jgi:hypothetical protein